MLFILPSAAKAEGILLLVGTAEAVP